MIDTIPVKLTRKDFVSDQAVRWCPGCGDYSILAAIQKTLPDIGVPKEDIVFISGIGCSSRFPYYMNTYGIHSIHGRAPTLATGLAISNPELSVWVVTGDGDGLSIGGNHLIHVIRRNVNLNILLFNNRIYGLTKGQFSPTSRQGTRTKSSPMGSLEQPLNPIALALASEATYIARTLDSHPKHLAETFHSAAQHIGTSFVEIYQNCIIFNPTEWNSISNRRSRDENLLYLEDGKPMVFGKNLDKGIRLNGFMPEVVELGDEYSIDDLIVHDVTSIQLAYILSSMEAPDFPAPLGVIRQVEKMSFTDGLMAQVRESQAKKGVGDLASLYNAADVWTISEQEEVTSKKVTGMLSLGAEEEYIDEIDRDPAETTVIQDQLTLEPISVLSPNVPITIEASASLAKAIRQMTSHGIGCMLITDAEDKLIGVFTERDVLMRIAGLVEDLTAVTVADYMTPNPITLSADLPIARALYEMSLHGFRHLPLVDDNGRPEGIISFRDVVHYLNQEVIE